MSVLERLIEDTLRDPLAAARAHAQSGGKVLGYVGAEIPVELILASGSFALRIPSFAQASTPMADRYLESSFSPDMRSIAEQYLQGTLDFIDAIIFPRSNDSAQRLYYYLCELRARGLAGGPEPLIYDLAKIPRTVSLNHSRMATRRLAAEIRVHEPALVGAILKRNRRRELFASAAQARMRAAGPPGSVMERIFRSADLCDAEVFDAAFEHWMSNAELKIEGRRVLLAGNAPPDERLHRAVEAAGGNIVSEMGNHASCAVTLPPIAPNGSFAAVADHYHDFGFGSRSFADRAILLRTLAQETAADAVILWLIEEEDALIWDLPAQLSALAAAGIPALPLVRRRWNGGDATLDEIASFMRMLEGSA
jgi:hypothetical protein